MIDPDNRPIHDFGVVKRGSWDQHGNPVGWTVNADQLADDLPKCLLDEPVLHFSTVPDFSVYVREYYSEKLTQERKRAASVDNPQDAV